MGTSLTPLILRETAAPSSPPTGSVALYSVDGSALLMKDDAGLVTTLGGGTKGSALSAASSLTDADVLFGINGGSTKKFDLSSLTAYFEARGRQNNASIAQQTWAAAEAYLTGSYLTVPANPSGGNRLQVKSKYRCTFYVAKTSVAGTAAPIINVKLGTAGTTADTTRAALTFAAQTAVADDGRVDVEVNFRVVGASAVIRAQGTLDHRLAATGLSTANTSITGTTSATFDSTVASIGIGLSVTWGTSFVGTTDLVGAELMNLA